MTDYEDQLMFGKPYICPYCGKGISRSGGILEIVKHDWECSKEHATPIKGEITQKDMDDLIKTLEERSKDDRDREEEYYKFLQAQVEAIMKRYGTGKEQNN